MRYYYVYIMASGKNGTLYIGVTNNLVKRGYEHKNNLIEGFTQTYKIHNLVYFEAFEDVKEAISREKQIKHWRRHWKIKTIVDFNPEWKDLYSKIL